MNCKDFQNQFEVGSNLSDEAKTHLGRCENCRIFEREEINLTQIIQNLPKVEAPEDFGFRLNSYITKTEKVKRPLPAVWQTLRFALPLSAAVLIFGFVILNSNLFISENHNQAAITENNNPELKENFEKDLSKKKVNLQEPTVAENVETNSGVKSIQPIAAGTQINRTASKQTAKIKQIKNVNKPANKINKPVEEDFSGSGNFASTQPPVLLPQNNSVNDEQTVFDVKRKTLLEIGILTEGKSWNVNAVRKASVAEKSDVQIGDVIVEINAIPVSAKIPPSENVKTKSLKILRAGKIINISVN